MGQPAAAGKRLQPAGGQPTFLMGGSDSAVATATPILQAMSKEIIYRGPVGSGTKLKLINNFLCGVQVAFAGGGLAWIEQTALIATQLSRCLSPERRDSPDQRDLCMFGDRELGGQLSTAPDRKGGSHADAEGGHADMSSLVEPLRRREMPRP
jgi:hypothetical protein